MRDLGDEASARLFIALLAQAASTGRLHDYRSTPQVREYRAAHSLNVHHGGGYRLLRALGIEVHASPARPGRGVRSADHLA